MDVKLLAQFLALDKSSINVCCLVAVVIATRHAIKKVKGRLYIDEFILMPNQ